MKKILLTIVAATFLLAAKAQNADVTIDEPINSSNNNDKIYTSVEKAPEFPGGGLEQFYKYLGSTIHYPDDARANNVQGRVIVTMIIEKDGSLTNIRVVRGVSSSLDKEALRALSLCPKWNPGTQNGRPVRVAYTVPISFTLTK